MSVGEDPVLAIGAALAPADLAKLCERLDDLARQGDRDVVVCDLAALTEPDLSTVEALARLELLARSLGWRLQLRQVSSQLQELLGLAGLTDVLGVQPRRQAEEREQPGGVEERVHREDPTV